MKGHCFDERTRLATAPPDETGEPRALKRELGALGDQAFGVGEKHELVDPGCEERRKVGRFDGNLLLDFLSVPQPGQLRERTTGLLEYAFRRGGFELDLELGGVLDESVQQGDCSAGGRSLSS